MIPGLRTYPEMKNSGIDWLGAVPLHWNVRTTKSLFREKNKRGGEGSLLSLTRTHGLVPQADVSSRPASASDTSKYKECKPGDLVMNRMQAWSGMFAVSKLRGLVSPDYSVFVPRETSNVHPAFFENLFRTPRLVGEFARRSKGIGDGFNRLYTPDFGAVKVAAPPLEEQTAIARFLDYFDRGISNYIRSKEKLIVLLDEYKQALFYQVVTGQIDVRTGEPYREYKESGVEWLGRVPMHWRLVPNKLLLRRRKVLVGARHPEYSLLSLTKQGVIIRDVSTGRGKFSADMSTFQEVRKGDLVFCLFDVPETPRTVGLSPHLGMITGAYDIFECDDPLLARYLEALYLAMDNSKLLQPLYSGLRNTIPTPRFRSAKALCPTSVEQTAIVRFLQRATVQVSQVVDCLSRQSKLLAEYRTRLIGDVVTGKLDVREAAINLPEFDPPDDNKAPDVSNAHHVLDLDEATAVA